MYIGREGTAGRVSGLWGALLMVRNKPGAQGSEEMIILASGYIFRKRDSLWFPHEDVGKGTRAAGLRGNLVLTLSLP